MPSLKLLNGGLAGIGGRFIGYFAFGHIAHGTQVSDSRHISGDLQLFGIGFPLGGSE